MKNLLLVALATTLLISSGRTAPASDDPFRRITVGNIVEEEGNFRGGAWGDYDGDGDLDLFVPRNDTRGGANLLYRNDTADGEESFTNVNAGGLLLEDSAIQSKVGVWGDYDGDGDLDLFVTNGAQEDFLYRNDTIGETTNFTRIVEGTSLVTNDGRSYAVAWGDCDQDGLLDLALENLTRSHTVFINRLDDISEQDLFTEVPLSVGGSGHSAHWVDFDEDGDLDLFMTDLTSLNRLYLNDGACNLTEMESHTLVADRASFLRADWGDYDGDGDLDLFVPDIFGDNLLYQNHGKGSFTRVTEGIVVSDGGLSHQGAWGDYDNDGDLDLVVPNGSSETEAKNYLYENQGDGTFEKIVDGALVNDLAASSGAAWGDYDGDGFLDVFFGNGSVNATKGYTNALYHNESIQNGNTNTWIKVECVGTVSNSSGFGTNVRVKAMLGGVERWQVRDIASRTTSSLDAHFGLADAAIVDEVRVEWPSGIVQVARGVLVNQTLTVTESDAPPAAHFTVSGEETGTVHVDADGSATPDGTEISSWEWDFGDGETATGEVANHIYQLPGRYVIALTVLNDVDVGHTIREMVTVPCPGGVVAPWIAADVGQPRFPGAARFEAVERELHVCAGGREISGEADEFFFGYQELSGDFRITLKVAEYVSASSGAQVGVMFRESLDEDARFAAMTIETQQNQSRLFRFLRRAQTGGSVGRFRGSEFADEAGWVRIERHGSELSGWSSLDGDSWELVRTQVMELPGTVFGGVAAVANDPGHTPAFEPLRVVINDLEATPPAFLRGDCNGDGKFDISDGVFNLNFLFGDGTSTDCTEACNANNDAQNDVSDAVTIFNRLFGAALPLAAPFPACGEDPAPESSLGCGRFACE